MTVLLHLSDTHFGTEQAEVLEALVALAHRLRPDLVVLSGDITQRARADQFLAARRFVDRLGAPWLAIPGNHDISLFDPWSRFARPYARYCAAFGDILEPCHETDDLLVMGVKTTRRWRHKHGEVSGDQVERVSRRLRAARDEQLRVVVVHQPIEVPPGPDEANLLRGHERAREAWAAAGADLVLGGHIHLPFVRSLAGTSRAAWAVQAGTAVSSRVRPGVPNSVNVVRWGDPAAAAADPGPVEGIAGHARDRAGAEPRAGRCITVEQWDHASARGAFERRAVARLVPAPALRTAA
jgi:3',5'-cyclic AMP phosphodiesterase CpdA